MSCKRFQEAVEHIIHLSKDDLNKLNDEELTINHNQLEDILAMTEGEKELMRSSYDKKICIAIIVSMKRKLKDIKDVIENKKKAQTLNNNNIKSKKISERAFTLNQKFLLLKKTGYINLIVDNFDPKIQHKIFSAICNCSEDTSRKIHNGSYKDTKDVRPLEFQQLLKHIENNKK